MTIILSPSEQKMALIRASARRFGTSVEAVTGPGHSRPAVYARWYAMALIRAQFSESYPLIGRRFGRDHSSVMNGIARLFGYTGTCQGRGEVIAQGLALFGEALRHEARQAIRDDAARKAAARADRLMREAGEVRHVAA